VHAGDGARNDETLDLTGPFEDRVDPVSANISTVHGAFRRRIDPQMSEEHSVWTHLGPIPNPVGGSRTSTAISRRG
jgi:hypothetical protein